MNPYFGKIEELTGQNTNFRQVLYTGQYCQLVVMSLKPGEEIGTEVHDTVDQFFRIEGGQGKVIVGEGEEHLVGDGDAIVIPAGTKHNVINASSTEDLKLYTIYAPPNHPDGTVHLTKAEADAYEAEHHGGQEAGASEPTAAATNEPTAQTMAKNAGEPVIDLSNIAPVPEPSASQGQTQTAPNPNPPISDQNQAE